MTTPATEITLAFGEQRAVVSSLGASLRRYFHLGADGKELDVVWGYSGDSSKKGGQGDVLIPFPGRVRAGKYAWAGKSHQLPITDKEGPNAIHGFVRSRTWEIVPESAARFDQVTFRLKLDAAELKGSGYPFSLDTTLRYSLGENGLSCWFRITNAGRSSHSVPSP